MSQDSPVGITMDYGLNGRGSIREGNKFSYLRKVQRDSGIHQPSSQLVLCALSPGIKQPWREADRSLPSSSAVKNSGAIPSLHTCLHGVVLNQLSRGTTLLSSV
jgi:hypothetical protein